MFVHGTIEPLETALQYIMNRGLGVAVRDWNGNRYMIYNVLKQARIELLNAPFIYDDNARTLTWLQPASRVAPQGESASLGTATDTGGRSLKLDYRVFYTIVA